MADRKELREAVQDFLEALPEDLDQSRWKKLQTRTRTNQDPHVLVGTEGG